MPAPTPRKPPKRPPSNIASRLKNINREIQLREDEEATRRAEAMMPTIKKPKSAGPRCPNKNCPNPKVVDGTCQTCGRVADDSNIVAEVQFGETSSGAAMVHGSYIGADQGGARSLGGFRRGGGTDQREKTLADARLTIQGIVAGLSLNKHSAPDHNVVDQAVQSFKLAAGANFTQGRTLNVVCAVCVYNAFRQQTDDPTEKPKVMLLDLADLVKVNVFKLGRTYKALVSKLNLPHVNTIYPEDIIYRFACKLDFGRNTGKVAEDALRLIRSMRRDWIIIGRRPSGICGACLLMAARMNNFRRTTREVVFVVKVTSHTIQERLKEFNETAASKMSVDDFLSPEFVDSTVESHDPPAFYRKTQEYKKKMEEARRERSSKRKRQASDDGAGDQPDATRQKSVEVQVQEPPEPVILGPDLSSLPEMKDVYLRDAEGYVIPLLPPPKEEGDSQQQKGGEGEDEDEDDADIDALAEGFADQPAQPRRRGRPPKGQGKPREKLPINDEWEEDEEDMEEVISEIMNDPETLDHAKAYANAEQRARLHAQWALEKEPSKEVSMDPLVGEDEFADDLEVMNAILTPQEAKIKEILWVNENKDWLRQNQERIFQAKLMGDKPKRPRKARKPRLGETEITPAATPIEAAQNIMKYHGMSKRLNYDAISRALNHNGGPSGTTSGQTSKANSVIGDAFKDAPAVDSDPEPEEGEDVRDVGGDVGAEEEDEYENDYLDEWDENAEGGDEFA